MHEFSEKIKEIEALIEKGLWDFELHNQLDKALHVYQDAEAKLGALGIQANDPAFADQQRVLSYCLMRQGNISRQMQKPQEALALGERELTAARASGDEITLARSLMSNGTNLIVSGEMERGLKLVDEGGELFKRGTSFDHQQGLGWYWILQADLANAGLVKKAPAEVIEIATRALSLLKPIENWPGVARAHAARSKAHEKLGENEQAEKDRQEQHAAESRIKSGEEGTE